jgi:molybdenum cofactor biosynthesis protein B
VSRAKPGASRRAAGSRAAARTREHARAQRAPRPVGVAVITVSDTRRGGDDTSGALAEALLADAGCAPVARAWVRDDVAAIRAALRKQLGKRGVDAVVLTGGTGVAPRDVTPEAVEPLLDRPLPGFGERFRALSWATVRSAAWLSRAGAGVARGRLVVYLPGSAGAVRQALESLLIPELVHVVRLLGRF